MKKILAFLIPLGATIGFGQVEQKQHPTDFLPKGFIVFERVNGDLNNDGVEDVAFHVNFHFLDNIKLSNK